MLEDGGVAELVALGADAPLVVDGPRALGVGDAAVSVAAPANASANHVYRRTRTRASQSRLFEECDQSHTCPQKHIDQRPGNQYHQRSTKAEMAKDVEHLCWLAS